MVIMLMTTLAPPVRMVPEGAGGAVGPDLYANEDESPGAP
jgi:hypothetical protein